MRESEVEKTLREEVKKAGGKAYKWVSPGNSGVPDRIVVLPNEAPIFVELKADGGKLSKVQEAQINLLVKLGQRVYVVEGIGGLEEFFLSAGMHDAWMRLRGRRTGHICVKKDEGGTSIVCGPKTEGRGEYGV